MILLIAIFLISGCLNQKVSLNEINSDYQLIEHNDTPGFESATFSSSVSKNTAEEFFNDWCNSHGYNELEMRNDSNVLAIRWLKSNGYCAINIRENNNQLEIKIVAVNTSKLGL